MSAFVGLVVVAGLVMIFPLVKRERKSVGCATGGCWKKQIGFGCGRCPLESGTAGQPDRDPDHVDESTVKSA